MKNFAYVKASRDEDAVTAGIATDAAFIAGGTCVVDLMRLDVEAPSTLVDVNALAWSKIEETRDGLSIGALVKNSDLAMHPAVRARFPVLSEALLAGASPQLRNMASVGGNVLQRTRCSYFRDVGSACNKRVPGSGCAALDGYTRMHAIFGTSEKCIAAHPSDMCVALVALDATVHTRGAKGERAIAIADFHTLPAAHPEIESVLQHGELITHVTVPASPFASRSTYVKVRDRASFAFALASAAVAIDLDGAKIRDVRVAVGGVATKPWRCRAVEDVLRAQTMSPDLFARAASNATIDARPRRDNAFKIQLVERAIVRALENLRGHA